MARIMVLDLGKSKIFPDCFNLYTGENDPYVHFSFVDTKQLDYQIPKFFCKIYVSNETQIVYGKDVKCFVPDKLAEFLIDTTQYSTYRLEFHKAFCERKGIKFNAIRYARQEAGLTQKGMSEKLGIPQRTIENWESDTYKPAKYVETLVVDKLLQLANNN